MRFISYQAHQKRFLRHLLSHLSYSIPSGVFYDEITHLFYPPHRLLNSRLLNPSPTSSPASSSPHRYPHGYRRLDRSCFLATFIGECAISSFSSILGFSPGLSVASLVTGSAITIAPNGLPSSTWCLESVLGTTLSDGIRLAFAEDDPEQVRASAAGGFGPHWEVASATPRPSRPDAGSRRTGGIDGSGRRKPPPPGLAAQ